MLQEVLFMRYSKAFIRFAALVLCIALPVSALSQGTLAELWNSGCDLLFRTDNVTVDGEATFSLDGERFKTAKLHYVQDGYNSYYGLTLLTPWSDGSDRESGWIIIADQADYPYEMAEFSNLSIMELRQPGIYRPGIGAANSTLLRRSVQLDALVDLGGLLVGQVESQLPEGAVTVSDQDGGKTVHIALTEDQIPPVAASALSLAAGYLADRWFSQGHDRSAAADTYIPFDSYLTVSQALTNGTVSWSLRRVDADFTTDSQGRLTAAKGDVKVASTFIKDAGVREVEVQFDLTVTDYGASRVKPFDPDEYGVVPYWEVEYGDDDAWEGLDEDAWDAWMNRAMDLLENQGFTVSPYADRGGWTFGNEINISIANPGGDEYFLVYTEDGSLVIMQMLTADWTDETEVKDVDEETVAAAEALIRSFAADQNPGIAEELGDLKAMSMMTDQEGHRFLHFDNGGSGAYFVVRLEPFMRLELFSIADAAED